MYNIVHDIIYAINAKEVSAMRTEAERQDTKKAMAYDLCNIIDESPAQQTYTPEEIKNLIRTYIAETEQQ